MPVKLKVIKLEIESGLGRFNVPWYSDGTKIQLERRSDLPDSSD